MVETYLRVCQKSGTYLIISLARLLTAIILNIYFVAFVRAGVYGIFLSNLITAVLFSLLAYPLMIRRVGLGFSFSLARQLLRYSLPVVPANLCSLVVNASDRFFVKSYFSLADAGIYSLGYKLGNVVFYLVRVPFMQIWSPRSFALYQEGASADIFARITTYFNFIMVFVGLGISVYVKDVIKIIASEPYWSAAQYAPAIALCYIIYALDNQVAFGIAIAKRTEFWTYVNLVSSSINIALNFLLISKYGIWGAVWATGLSIVVKVSLLHFVGRHFYKIPFEWMRMAGISGLAVGLYFASHLVEFQRLEVTILVDSVFILAFPALVWFGGIIKEEEKLLMFKLARKILERIPQGVTASK